MDHIFAMSLLPLDLRSFLVHDLLRVMNEISFIVKTSTKGTAYTVPCTHDGCTCTETRNSKKMKHGKCVTCKHSAKCHYNPDLCRGILDGCTCKLTFEQVRGKIEEKKAIVMDETRSSSGYVGSESSRDAAAFEAADRIQDDLCPDCSHGIDKHKGAFAHIKADEKTIYKLQRMVPMCYYLSGEWFPEGHQYNINGAFIVIAYFQASTNFNQSVFTMVENAHEIRGALYLLFRYFHAHPSGLRRTQYVGKPEIKEYTFAENYEPRVIYTLSSLLNIYEHSWEYLKSIVEPLKRYDGRWKSVQWVPGSVENAKNQGFLIMQAVLTEYGCIRNHDMLAELIFQIRSPLSDCVRSVLDSLQVYSNFLGDSRKAKDVDSEDGDESSNESHESESKDSDSDDSNDSDGIGPSGTEETSEVLLSSESLSEFGPTSVVPSFSQTQGGMEDASLDMIPTMTLMTSTANLLVDNQRTSLYSQHKGISFIRDLEAVGHNFGYALTKSQKGKPRKKKSRNGDEKFESALKDNRNTQKQTTLFNTWFIWWKHCFSTMINNNRTTKSSSSNNSQSQQNEETEDSSQTGILHHMNERADYCSSFYNGLAWICGGGIKMTDEAAVRYSSALNRTLVVGFMKNQQDMAVDISQTFSAMTAQVKMLFGQRPLGTLNAISNALDEARPVIRELCDLPYEESNLNILSGTREVLELLKVDDPNEELNEFIDRITEKLETFKRAGSGEELYDLFDFHACKEDFKTKDDVRRFFETADLKMYSRMVNEKNKDLKKEKKNVTMLKCAFTKIAGAVHAKPGQRQQLMTQLADDFRKSHPGLYKDLAETLTELGSVIDERPSRTQTGSVPKQDYKLLNSTGLRAGNKRSHESDGGETQKGGGMDTLKKKKVAQNNNKRKNPSSNSGIDTSKKLVSYSHSAKIK